VFARKRSTPDHFKKDPQWSLPERLCLMKPVKICGGYQRNEQDYATSIDYCVAKRPKSPSSKDKIFKKNCKTIGSLSSSQSNCACQIIANWFF